MKLNLKYIYTIIQSRKVHSKHIVGFWRVKKVQLHGSINRAIALLQINNFKPHTELMKAKNILMIYHLSSQTKKFIV